ncbi:hypothetical protein [Bradyrhizobium cosmicum]|uniref:hypothetical protein n=1 Tax=Bradyrhizobium cosmicum TaxID=1404864 RepID=UPI0028E70194|nr:hypothetical protein [Bradyrhizobium cosmicum]
MNADDDEGTKEVIAWMDSESVDAVADYAQRGRRLVGLSEEDLITSWRMAFKAWADAFFDEQLRRVESDYLSEFQLRGIEPPYEQVRDDMHRMAEHAKKVFASLGPEDAVELDRRTESAFEAFRQRIVEDRN